MSMTNENKQAGATVGLPAGARIGKYEIRERLGIGGQAIVYKGYDALLDRCVAIKQISSHLAEDPKFMDRFRREAQILAKLGADEPAIVTIHDLIEDERGLFIVMEFIAGNSLETILNDTNGPVESKAALQVIWRLAAALHAVHSAGIIHRDIKPGNILIGEGLRPKITDFGVAVSVTGQTSMVLGTTKYMAPELFAGGLVDGRVDEYSLGFIAYEMLAGRPKFNEIFADVVRDKHSEALRWMKWHGNESVQAPLLHEVNPAVPRPLSEIVSRMIAKKPEDRFASMEELGRAIKSTFSPRARAAAEAAVPVAPKRRFPRPARSAAEGLSAPRPGVLAQDEGDEFDVMPAAPATAPLPKKKLSSRTKLILVSGVIVLLIAVGVIAAVILSRPGAGAQAAPNAYKAAWSLYDSRHFADAQKGFKEVLGRFPGTPEASKASVMYHLSLAQQAVLDGDWQTAAGEETEAGNEIRNVGSGLSKWADERGEELKNFTTYRTNARGFETEMQKARKVFEAKEFHAARDILETGNMTRIVLTDDQVARRQEFIGAIAVAECKDGFVRIVAGGDDMARQAKYGEADKEYKRALAFLLATGPKILPAGDMAAMKKLVEDKISHAANTGEYEALMAEAEGYKASGDTNAEKEAVEKANKLRPSEALAARIKGLEVKLLLEKGAQAKANGKLDDARKAYDDALALDPKNGEAVVALAEITQTVRRRELISQGDVAHTAGQYAEGLEKYVEASKIRQDEDLDRKIVDCRYQIKLAEAKKLVEAKEYEKAYKALDEARAVKPDAGGEIDAIVAAGRQQQQYESFLALGDAALKERQWAKAVDRFKDAQKISSTPEVADRIKSAHYGENIAHGRDALDQRNFVGALAYFRLAKDIKDTEEVRQLIQEADKGTNAGGG
jgi:tetratricopeptide (TPR) repeat protein